MKTRRWIYAALGTTVLVIASVVIFFALRGPNLGDAILAGYRITDDPRVIVLVATTSQTDEIIRSDIREQPDKIVVAVKVRADDRPGTHDPIDRDITIRLTEPVGNREIVRSDGRELSEVPEPARQ